MTAKLLSRRHAHRTCCDICGRGGQCARLILPPQNSTGAMFTAPQTIDMCGGCMREGVRIVAKKARPK